jgi:hypothetical protein
LRPGSKVDIDWFTRVEHALLVGVFNARARMRSWDR